MQMLTCSDRKGQTASFAYTVTRDMSGTKWDYRVRPFGASADSEFFQLSVVELDADTVRVTMLANNNYAPVSGKGVPDALIPRIAVELGRRVQSSPPRGETGDVYRTDDATKMWKRLLAAGKSHFDADADIYFVRKPV